MNRISTKYENKKNLALNVDESIFIMHNEIDEGQILRALATFYKGTAGELARDLDMTRNQLNYLYKQTSLSDQFKENLIISLSSKNKWHENTRQIANLLFPFRFSTKKKNSDNANSLVDINDSTVANHSYNSDLQEISRLREDKKQKQARINELKEELKNEKLKNEKLTETINGLSGRIAALSERLMDYITKK